MSIPTAQTPGRERQFHASSVRADSELAGVASCVEHPQGQCPTGLWGITTRSSTESQNARSGTRDRVAVLAMSSTERQANDLFGRHESLQLLGPVLHDDDL